MAKQPTLLEMSLDRWTHLIALRGECDLHIAPALDRQLRDAIEEGRNHLIVDLTDVTFLDSTVLGALAGGLRRAQRRKGGLAVVCPTGAGVRRVFEVTGLDNVIKVVASRADARRVLAGVPASA